MLDGRPSLDPPIARIIPMELNKKVADFILQTDEDKTVSLSDYAGKPVILFFYPQSRYSRLHHRGLRLSRYL